MLLNILPGIRELRTPLAVGYVWMAALIPILIHNLLPILQESQPNVKMNGLLSPDWQLPAFAVLTFSAYILGILSIGLSSPLLPRIGKLQIGDRDNWILPLRVQTPLEFIAKREITKAMQNPSSTRSRIAQQYRKILEDPQKFDADTPEDIRVLKRSVEILQASSELNKNDAWGFFYTVASTFNIVQALGKELPKLSQQILGKEEKIYDLYDRAKSEGEFRVGIAFPIVGLAAIWFDKPKMSWFWNPVEVFKFAAKNLTPSSSAFLILVAIALILFRLGLNSYASSLAVLANALAADRVSLDVVGEIITMSEQIRFDNSIFTSYLPSIAHDD